MFLIEFRYRTQTNYSSHGSVTGQRLTIVLMGFRYRTQTNYSSHGSVTGQRLTIVLKGAQGQELLILFMGIRGKTHSSQYAGDAFAK
jgi:hypothetical protein